MSGETDIVVRAKLCVYGKNREATLFRSKMIVFVVGASIRMVREQSLSATLVKSWMKPAKDDRWTATSDFPFMGVGRKGAVVFR